MKGHWKSWRSLITSFGELLVNYLFAISMLARAVFARTTRPLSANLLLFAFLNLGCYDSNLYKPTHNL